MANTKGTQNRTNKSGRSSSSKKGSSRKKKNSSDDTMKFLLVLIIAGIAIALIFFSQSDEEGKTGNMVTGTPTPTVMEEATNSPKPTNTPKPTEAVVPTPGQQAEPTEEPEPTVTPEATEAPVPTNTPTPAPTPAVSAEEAREKVKEQVDTSVYDLQMVNDNLKVGNGSYYQFGAISGQEFVYPFLVVNKLDGTLHFYDSTEDTVFDFTKFPLQAEATTAPTPTKAPAGNLTAEEAYGVLCTYSKDALHIAKEVKEYDAEYGNELTFINGVDCYRFNLSEYSNGKVRNRGEFYVSVDGKKCYYIDSNTNEFVEAAK